MGSEMIEVLVPAAALAIEQNALAERPTSLAGLRIGLLDNLKPNAGLLLDSVATELGIDSSDIEWGKKTAAQPAPAEVMGRLEKCDAVLLAMAD